MWFLDSFRLTVVELLQWDMVCRLHLVSLLACIYLHVNLHAISCCSVHRNCNWGACIAPPTGRPRAHHRVNPYLGARRQNETEMFSDHDETSPSIAAVSAPSVACSMLAMQQQKRLCRQFVDVSAARRGCHTLKHAVPEYWMNEWMNESAVI